MSAFPPTAVRDLYSTCSSQFENNYFTEMCRGSEAGSYLRLTDFVYHSTLGLGVIKKKKNAGELRGPRSGGRLFPPCL